MVIPIAILNNSPSVDDIRDRLVAVPAATRSGGVPARGWARLAMVLQGLHRTAQAIIVVDMSDGGNLAIDWGRKDYWWNGAPAVFPADPTIASIRMLRGDGAQLPFLRESPLPLEPLLWNIGIAAFPSTQAWWFSDGGRYRATRWPNYTVLEHDPDQVRMTALLGSAALTPTELALAANVEPSAAQRLLNALGLLGLVRELPVGETDVSVRPVDVPTQRKGLFSRLRARLGV